MKYIKYDRFTVRDPNAEEIEPIEKPMTVTKTQITIPKNFMEILGWEVGSRVEIVFTPRYIVLKKHYKGLQIQKANSQGSGAIYIGEIRSQITKNTGEPEFIPYGPVRCVCDQARQEIVYKQIEENTKKETENNYESKSNRWCIHHHQRNQSGRVQETYEVQPDGDEA